MALSNNFFGLRQGSTKSLTFQVYNGKQVTKDRVSLISNPRTREQMIQRAIVATVVRMYQIGQPFFDHSFQGYSYHDGAMARFLSLNTRILRDLYLSDIEKSDPTQMVARFAAMSVEASVGCPNLCASEGTLQQNLFQLYTSSTSSSGYKLVQPRSNERVSEWAQRLGLQKGDIYTFVVIASPILGGTPVASYGSDLWGRVYNMSLTFVRMIVKDWVFESSAVLDPHSVRYMDIFDIDDPAYLSIGNMRVEDSLTFGRYFQDNNGVFTMIRSLKDTTMRSTSYFNLGYPNTPLYRGLQYGLTADLLPLSWISNTQVFGLQSGVPKPLIHAVDMGLPSGLLWADVNLDITQPDNLARSPYQYEGSFCSWGNTDMYNPNDEESFVGVYDWGGVNAQEPWYEGQPYGSTPGAALTENIGPANDVARHLLGALWHMPSVVEFQELFDNCDFIDANGNIVTAATSVAGTDADKRITMNGVVGLRLRSKINGAIIFLPASGDGNGTTWRRQGTRGEYWSSSWFSDRLARYLVFYSGGVDPQNSNPRFSGMAIRPVYGAYNE